MRPPTPTLPAPGDFFLISKRARARLGLPMRLWVPGRPTGRRQLGEACRLRRTIALYEPAGARPQLAGTRGALRKSAMHDRAAGRELLPVPVTGRRPLSEAARPGARMRYGSGPGRAAGGRGERKRLRAGAPPGASPAFGSTTKERSFQTKFRDNRDVRPRNRRKNATAS
jgi:hypothetical protein